MEKSEEEQFFTMSRFHLLEDAAASNWPALRMRNRTAFYPD
jgi:hypothetical protein